MSAVQPPEQRYYLTLLRHGESVGNALGYHQGQSDFPLTETGREQARALANRWQAEKAHFDLVIASPLLRARQTAEIIAAALEVPLVFDWDWMERDAGLLAGLHASEAKQELPEPDFFEIYQPFGLTGESQWELYLRAGQAVNAILRRPAGSYLIVSHGGILSMALHAILGITVQANFQGVHFRFRNTGYTKFIYNPGRHIWYMLGLDERPHWADPESH